jgi:hypothetical protein
LISKRKFELATYKYLVNQGVDIFKNGKGTLEIYDPYSYDNEKIIIDNNDSLAQNITNILFPYEMYSYNIWGNKDKDKDKNENEDENDIEESIFSNVDFYEFHNQFVNSDVRRYFLFRMSLLKKDEYVRKLFTSETGRRHPSNKYEYLATLILGAKIKNDNFVDEKGWYYNNKHIGYEAYHSEIITFNVFETFDLSRLVSENNSYEKTFYIYIRILELLYIDVLDDEKDEENYSIGKIFENLSPFFPDEIIERALQNMIYSGFLIETEIGSRNFLGESVGQPEKIELLNGDGVYGKIMNNKNTAAHIYYTGIIREFEYIYNMSWYYVKKENSALLDKNKNEQGFNYIQKARDEYFDGRSDFNNAEKEESTILFLIAMFYITKCSTEIQIKEKTREKFKKIFVINPITHENHKNAYYPLDKMMISVKKSMKRKIRFCNDKIRKGGLNNIDYFVKRKEPLERLLNALEILIKDTDDYFEKINNVNNKEEVLV